MPTLQEIDWPRIALNAVYVGGAAFFAVLAADGMTWVQALKPTAIAFGGAFLFSLGLEMRRKGWWDGAEGGRGTKALHSAVFLL